MKVYICAKYAKTKVYTAIAFVNIKGVIERVECICNNKTSTKYIGYMHGMLKALSLIDKGIVVADTFDFICDSDDMIRWFEGSKDLKDVPKQHRAMFSDVLLMCEHSPSVINIIRAKGLNYARKYASEKYYNETTSTQIEGVSAVDFFSSIGV